MSIMTTDPVALEEEYYDWLTGKILGDGRFVPSSEYGYSKLLETLDKIEYRYNNVMDESRYVDGITNRYHFADDIHINKDYAGDVLARVPSVLEVMVALSWRINNILQRTNRDRSEPRWFWDMIFSLGLEIYTDDAFDEGEVIRIVNKALDGDISREGEGGFFTVDTSLFPNVNLDMRKLDLWSQSSWYEREILIRDGR